MFDRHHTCTKLATEVKQVWRCVLWKGIKSSQSNNGDAMSSPRLKESAENKTHFMILFNFRFWSFVTCDLRSGDQASQRAGGLDQIWLMSVEKHQDSPQRCKLAPVKRCNLMLQPSLISVKMNYLILFKLPPFKMSGAQLNGGFCMFNIGAEDLVSVQ